MTFVKRRDLKRSQDQEKRGAKLHGGRVRPASGAFATAKGDVRTGPFLIEYKRTDAHRITITEESLEKIRREALLEGRMQLLGFELGRRDYVVIEAEDLAALQEELDGYRQGGSSP